MIKGGRMKRFIISCLIVIIIVIIGISTYLTKTKDNNDNLTKVTVAEATLTKWKFLSKKILITFHFSQIAI